MKKTTGVLTLFITLLCAASFAGGLSSGGGNVVVCNQGKKGESVELLDLYEARAQYGLTLITSAAAYHDQVKVSLKRLEDATSI